MWWPLVFSECGTSSICRQAGARKNWLPVFLTCYSGGRTSAPRVSGVEQETLTFQPHSQNLAFATQRLRRGEMPAGGLPPHSEILYLLSWGQRKLHLLPHTHPKERFQQTELGTAVSGSSSSGTGFHALMRLSKFSWKMFVHLLYGCLWDIKWLFLLQFLSVQIVSLEITSTGQLMLAFWK